MDPPLPGLTFERLPLAKLDEADAIEAASSPAHEAAQGLPHVPPRPPGPGPFLRRDRSDLRTGRASPPARSIEFGDRAPLLRRSCGAAAVSTRIAANHY